MAIALSKAYRSPIVDTIQSLPQHQQVNRILITWRSLRLKLGALLDLLMHLKL